MVSSVNITVRNAGRHRLGDLVALRAGYSFRAAIPEFPDGDVLAVQLRDIKRETVNWSTSVRTRLARAPREDEWLRRGDILLVFRGTRYLAVALDQVPEPSVASTQFMLLRVLESETLLPEFLAWQINQPFAQAYFQKAAEGTAQQSLRRGVIEALEVVVPSVRQQHTVMELVSQVRSERELVEEQLRTREQEVFGVAMELLWNDEPGVDS